ncbi:MAG: hypothetical protein LBI37_00490 [Puniceicoccales bacterium]|jgi:YrbI family 3-deoxy-D-manno-octulosonate 8-phosphate phosphatase|nr:hypothetical protein [Puniceicoccales bacterium]
MQTTDILSKKLVVVGDGVVYDGARVVRLSQGIRNRGEYVYIADIEDVSSDTLVCFNTYDGFSMKRVLIDIFHMGVVLTASSDEFSEILRRRSRGIASGNCFPGMKSKYLFLNKLCAKFGVKPSDVIYIDDYLAGERELLGTLGIVISRDISDYVEHADCELVEIREPHCGLVRDFTNEYLDGHGEVLEFYRRTKRWKAATDFEIKSERRTTRVLALDVDGTCTDAMRILSVNGVEYKRFNIKDIEALMRWVAGGNLVFFITGDPGRIAMNFARHIGLEDSVVFAEVEDRKVKIINELCKKNGFSLGEVAYMGDDVNDLGALEHIAEQNGIAACPAGAIPLIKACPGVVRLKSFGGDGAVAELISMLGG